MQRLIRKIEHIDWLRVSDELGTQGYTLIEHCLDQAQCAALINSFDRPDGFRKTVDMARYRYGSGVYKYWDYPLPDMVQTLREHLYPRLVPVANRWMEQLGLESIFPADFGALQRQCFDNGQRKPTPLILQYTQGGFNTLHQDLYGRIYFPLQAACFLSRPGEDYTGGEFVMTQQVPRAQPKAIVLQPGMGDLLIFATNFRPVEGSRGYVRATMKHGVSQVHSGKRYAAGIIFHDAGS